MEDTTPEKTETVASLQMTPVTPVNNHQEVFRHLDGYLDSPANLLIPSSLFRPWDTPESLSPTSSNIATESLSPTSSNVAPSDTSSPPNSSSPLSSLPSSPEYITNLDSSPNSQNIYGPNGTCLYKIEPLETLSSGQGVFSENFINNKENQDNLDFISGKDRKRKRKFQASAASPFLAKKSRTVTKGEFPPCGVCGAESTGVHYGAPVCEGCKGFFRRRVVYRDVSALVCGTGGQCNVTGKGRIHCKLCRYNRCVQIGMKPSSIKQEVKLTSNLTLEEQLLRCHKETMTPVPAVYLARQHTENIGQCVASEWPVSADLGPVHSSAQGPSDVTRYVTSLPGWSEMSSQDQQWSLTTGTVQVMLVRLLSRYRPEVGAYLFPCGQFVYPSQLTGSLSELTCSYMTSLAHNLASRGLTQQEMSLITALVSVNPLSGSKLYKDTIAAIGESSSSIHLTDLALQISELAWSATPDQWTNICINSEVVNNSFNDLSIPLM